MMKKTDHEKFFFFKVTSKLMIGHSDFFAGICIRLWCSYSSQWIHSCTDYFWISVWLQRSQLYWLLWFRWKGTGMNVSVGTAFSQVHWLVNVSSHWVMWKIKLGDFETKPSNLYMFRLFVCFSFDRLQHLMGSRLFCLKQDQHQAVITRYAFRDLCIIENFHSFIALSMEILIGLGFMPKESQSLQNRVKKSGG